ncbi:mate-domain-containing protein, partial [Fragilariopsis cylindrus CCMP1102]
ELAAAALATTLCNVTGMSLCIGFSFALSTLAGQAKGEMFSRPKKQNNSNDTAPIQAIVLPVGIWWIYGIENFLIALGQTSVLAVASSNYLQILAPSLWLYAIQWTVTAWTQSIGLASIPAQASLLGLICHIPFNYLFVYLLGFGYLGCAYATICFQAIQLCYISIYLFISQQGKQKVLIATGGQHIEYLNLAIPGIIVISEWWASETAIFLSGTIQPYPQTTLAAMTIYQSINSFCFMIPAGFATAGCARVSNLLGGGYYREAKLAGQINVTCCGIASTCIGLLLFLLPHTLLPSLFVSSKDNQAIINQTASTIPYLSIYVLADGIQTGCNGIIKGCGRQKIVVPIVVFAYWIVGVPLAYYL